MRRVHVLMLTFLLHGYELPTCRHFRLYYNNQAHVDYSELFIFYYRKIKKPEETVLSPYHNTN